MKSTEARAESRENRELERLTRAIAGRSPDDFRPYGSLVPKELDWFKPHPANAVFNAAKTERYWRDLERDIREAGRIIDPVVALPDGTLIEGHSRITIARKLSEEGVQLGRVQTVVIDLSTEEAERRVYLGNLSRFELDEDTRLVLYAKVWPDYYLDAKPGRPKKGDTVSSFQENLQVTKREEIATATGRSERQVRRDRSIIQDATELARAQGRSHPNVEDIHAARQGALSDRRKKHASASSRVGEPNGRMPQGVVTVQLTYDEVDEIVQALSARPSPHSAEIAQRLKVMARSVQDSMPHQEEL